MKTFIEDDWEYDNVKHVQVLRTLTQKHFPYFSFFFFFFFFKMQQMQNY